MIYAPQVTTPLSSNWKGLIHAKGGDTLSPFVAVKTVSAALNFANTLPQTSSVLTVSEPSATTKDLVEIIPAVKTANIFFDGYVAVDGVITVRLNNYSASSVNLPSASYTIKLMPQIL